MPPSEGGGGGSKAYKADTQVKAFTKGRLLGNIVFFSSGILVGFYVSALSAGHQLIEPATPKMVLKSQFEVASHETAARKTTSCICPGGGVGCESPGGSGSTMLRSGGGREALAAQDNRSTVDGRSADFKSLAPHKVKDMTGIEAMGFVDGKASFDAFYSHLPYNIRDQTSKEGVLLATKASGFRSSKAYKPGDRFEMQDLSTCKEVDVMLLSKGRCYVAMNTDLLFSSYHLQRYKHQDSGADEWQMLPRITKEGSSPPLPINRQKHERFLRDLFNNLSDLEKEAGRVLRDAADSKNRVLIMAMNQGDVDMLLNFLCSAHTNNINIDNLVVFGGDQVVADIAKSLGIRAFWHPAFGELPTAHAKHYGDAGFLAMMWLKIVSVWVAVRLGFDVLFQDADLVWFKSPWPMFEDASIDGFFMDDGSRSERFSPLYANSGFYYLRSNPRINHFMQTVLFSYDMIVQYASHQTIFIQALQEHISRNALRVRLLRDVDFVGGKVFHHNKKLMGKIAKGEYVPYTFHMCWSQTKADKLRFFQEAGLWYVEDMCTVPQPPQPPLGSKLPPPPPSSPTDSHSPLKLPDDDGITPTGILDACCKPLFASSVADSALPQ